MNLFDRRLLRQAGPVKPDLALAIGLGLLAGIFTVLQARYLSRTVGLVFLAGTNLAGVGPWLLALLLAGVGRATAVWAGEVSASRVAARVKADLRERLFAHLLALGPAYAREERTGELTNTLVEGVEALDAYFSQYLPQLALAALVPLTVFAFVFPLDLISGLVLLLTAPLIPLFMILIGNLADALTRKQWTALSRMSAHFLDVLQGLTTLKLFNRSREQIAAIAEVSERYRQTTMGVLRVTFLSALVLELVTTISTAVVAVEIGLRLLYSQGTPGAWHLSFEQAFFVLILAPEFYLPLRLLATRFHAGMAGVTAGRRIFAILEDDNLDHEDVKAPEEHEARRGGVRFEDVCYAYADGSRPALHHVSFEILPGQKVALVGPSGAGKSTVAHLLLRFIEPTAGRISMGGDRSAADWRSQVAWVPQLPYLFNASVADNIRLGRPAADLEEVIEAARQAHAHDFIQELPQGYDTIIGERGARLSGGQAQRIALARAFLKDAPFIILDEATANLDPEHQALVLAAIERLLEGRTALIIAHRLEAVSLADRILVLDGGRLVEEGTHEELMARNGAYSRLVAAYGVTRNLFRNLTFTHSAQMLRSDTIIAADPSGREAPCKGFGRTRSRHSRRQCCFRSDRNPKGLARRSSRQTLRVAKHPVRVSGARGRGIRGDNAASGVTETRRVSAGTGRADARGALATLHSLISFLLPFWPWIALSVLLGFATVGSGIGLMATAAWIIAGAALHPSIAVLQVAIVGVRFFGLARGVFRYLERLVSHQVTFRVLARVRVWFYAAVEPLAPARLLEHRSGDLLSRIVADVETLQNFYIRAVAPPAVALLVAGLMAVFLGSFDPRLAAGLLAFFLAAGLGVPLLTYLLSRRPGGALVSARARLNATLVDGIQGMADLVAFGQESAQMARVRALSAGLIGLQRQMARIGGLHAGLGTLLVGLAVLTVLILAIPLVNAGRIAGVNLAVLVLAAAASFEAVLPLPLAAQHLESSLAAGRRLLEIARGPRAETESRAAGPGISRFDIRFENVRFRYTPADRPALDRVSFVVPAGGRVAVVGPSGAGKSTLVNLLLRFWDYQDGHIWLAGRELREWDPEEVRRLIAVVTQSTYLFNATVRDNLLLARPGATQAELEQAARQAQIHDFILSLPQGYDTWVGEQGLRLSGGERQRLAIARALLKDAPILILDEATANLDPITERAVFQAIQTLMTGRTTLIITHRPVGLEDVDGVVTLRAGRVINRSPL